MGKGKGSTDEYPFMQTPDLLSHFLHLGYTNSTLSPIWAPTVRRYPPPNPNPNLFHFTTFP